MTSVKACIHTNLHICTKAFTQLFSSNYCKLRINIFRLDYLHLYAHFIDVFLSAGYICLQFILTTVTCFRAVSHPVSKALICNYLN